VTDLFAHTGLLNVSLWHLCLGNEFVPKRLVKFRLDFVKKKRKSLFHHKLPEDLIERVWMEIGENIQDAVQIVQDDDDVFSVDSDHQQMKSST